MRAFAGHGFAVEICPGFDPATWGGGCLPFRVDRAPPELTGVRLGGPAVAGFEIAFGPQSAHLRTAAGRTTTDFALQCVGAALLAGLTGGEYIDDQNELVCGPAEALAAAEREVRAFLAAAGPEELATHPFPGWSALM